MSILTSPASEDAFVAQQFDDIEQQREAAKLGMWIFLATEVLFFGGLFLGYTIYRFTYGQIFVETSRKLEVLLGGTNTAVLLISSLLDGIRRACGKTRSKANADVATHRHCFARVCLHVD
jgi:cytochrome c oxidase subunit 3